MSTVIVLVDDFEPYRRTIKVGLEERGYTVLSFPTVEKAQKGVENQKVGLWIVDGNISGPDDGFRFALELQQQDQPVLSYASELPTEFAGKIMNFHPKGSAFGDLLKRVKELFRE